MNTPEIILALFFIRLILPFGAILVLGEWMDRRERKQRADHEVTDEQS